MNNLQSMYTWSSDSRYSMIFAGMRPRMPPPSILSIVNSPSCGCGTAETNRAIVDQSMIGNQRKMCVCAGLALWWYVFSYAVSIYIATRGQGGHHVLMEGGWPVAVAN